MSNRPIKVRQGTNGPLLKGSATQVATQDGEEEISMQDAGGGSGTVTPLSTIRVVDHLSTAGSPNGGFSRNAAFATIQAAVTDLSPAGGTVVLAGGTYDEDILIPGTFVFRGFGGKVGTALGTTIAGDFAQNSAASDVTVYDCNIPAAVSFAGAHLTLVGCAEVSTVSAAHLSARNTAFTDLLTVGVLDSISACTFAAAVTCIASGTSIVNDSTFTDVQFDSAHLEGCTISGHLTGDGSGGILLVDCLATGTTDVPLTWDSTTELRSMKGGFNPSGSFMLALSSGQGGDADIQTGDATVNFSGNTRSIYPRSLAGAATFTLTTTGSVGLQTYTLDVYANAHAVTCKFGAGTLIVVPAQTTGQGTRVTFEVNSGVTAVALLFVEKL